jgi:hypothetical protein
MSACFTATTPTSGAPDYTKKLPRELRHLISGLLAMNDLKNLRLINKEWNVSAASALWVSLTTHLQETPIRSLDELLAGGCLNFVRELGIRSSYSPQPALSVDDALIQVLLALPQDRLRKFEVDNQLHCRTVGLLIKNQTQLKSLSVSILLGSVPAAAFLQDNLQKLVELKITLGDIATYGQWFSHTPKLEYLTLQSLESVDPHTLVDWVPPMGSGPLKLRSLSLKRLKLKCIPGQIGHLTQLSTLEVLSISECRSVGYFIEQLAKDFSQCDHVGLKTFVISQTRRARNWSRDFEKLLKSFSGLDTIYVSAYRINRIAVDAIGQHGGTLRYLHIDQSNDFTFDHDDPDVDRYELAELEELVEKCSNIEELGLNLGEPSFSSTSDLTYFHIVDSSKRTIVGELFAITLVCIAPLDIIS